MNKKTRRSIDLISVLVMAALFIVMLPVVGLSADVYTLTSNNSEVSIDPSSSEGMFGWFVDDVNQLASQWWYYRIGDGVPEQAIGNLGPYTVTPLGPNALQILFRGQSIDFTVLYTLVGGQYGSRSATIAESVRIRNKTSAPLPFQLFEYTDFDLNDTPDDDTVALSNRSSISQWDGDVMATESASVGGVTPTPDYYDLGESLDILDLLTDGNIDVLPSDATQVGPCNAAFAFQWNFLIPANGTALLSKSKVIQPSGSLGDYVWYDANADGVQDDDEFGIPNVKVIIQGDLDFDGVYEFTLETYTDAQGGYLFGNLPAGNYIVSVDTSTLPAGMTQTYDLDGLGSPNSAEVHLDSAEVNLDVDFGYTGLGSISGLIFRDCDANGKYNNGEAGMPGVQVTLKDTDGNIIATTVTDAEGRYFFPNLPAKQYIVVVDPAPEGYIQTFDMDKVKDNKTTVALSQGEQRTNVNFGYTGTLPSVSIEKTGPSYAKVGETITYHFRVENTGNTCLYGGMKVVDQMLGGTIWHKTPVLPGEVYEFDVTYVVKKPCSGNKIVNTATVIGCPPIGKNASDASSWTVIIDEGCSNTINASVFSDTNGNGKKDCGEAGLGGITATLKDSSGKVVATVVTKADGSYSFKPIPKGTYYVCINIPAGYALTYDPDGKLDGCTSVVLNGCGLTKAVQFGLSGKRAGVSIEKTGPDTAKVGETIKYTFRIVNTGNAYLSGVSVSDPLLGGVIWNKSSMAPGEVAEFTRTYVVKSSSSNKLVNTATVSACSSVCGKVSASDFWTVSIVSSGCSKPVTYPWRWWCTKPSGKNPGWLLNDCFKKVYRCGYVKIGGKRTIRFDSASCIQKFLPCSGKSSALKCNYSNPFKSTSAGVFASHVLALRLSVDFSQAGVTCPGLADIKLRTGKCSGKTIGQVLTMAEAVLGGDANALPRGMTVAGLSDVVSGINEMYCPE